VGIYLGHGKMLDAPKTGDVVKIQKVWATPSHIRRVLPADAWSSSSSSAASVAGASAAQRISGPGGSSSGRVGGPYADLFAASGRKYGVDPALLSAVAKNESGYRADAVSHAGARGLMQIMPATARGLGIDALDPKQAVDGAARLLSGYLDDYDGNVKLALAAYNAGPGNVKKYGGVPPFNETRTYITRVTDTWKDLR
jgi:soluble lytic murein transglycosylase-like protein